MSSPRYCWILFAGLLPGVQPQSGVPTKPQQSAITIHVFKAGLFSGFAHNHVVVAPISRTNLDPSRLSAELTVITNEMKVMDPEVSEKDRAEIQSTMLGPKVLDAERYPEIHFRSSRIEQISPQHYRITGTLALHGTNKELTLEASGGPERYHGATKLKQSEFGIKPISLLGGSVKVKDELELDFDVYATAPAGSPGAPPAAKK